MCLEYVWRVTGYTFSVAYRDVLLNIVKYFLIVWSHKSKGSRYTGVPGKDEIIIQNSLDMQPAFMIIKQGTLPVSWMGRRFKYAVLQMALLWKIFKMKHKRERHKKRT